MPPTADTRAEYQAAEPLDPAAWIPLTELALEGFGYAATLDARVLNLRNDLADEILLDDIGRACVPRSVARQLFAQRAENQLQAQVQNAAERSDAEQRGNPVRERVRAIQARQSTGDPLSDMKRDDIETDWARAADRRNELVASERTGRLKYHSIREQEH